MLLLFFKCGDQSPYTKSTVILLIDGYNVSIDILSAVNVVFALIIVSSLVYTLQDIVLQNTQTFV